MYILKPLRQDFDMPPLFYTPPTPRRVFSGVGGVGVYKMWPRKILAFWVGFPGVFLEKARKFQKMIGALLA